ncbi:hypothetical protein AUG19_08735 [archaeon 13_1_20CM_2_54_9]|nr:MAG: hypothetical protein AUG19_08735 [archaeon 13_1_20CM_2_54_9]
MICLTHSIDRPVLTGFFRLTKYFPVGRALDLGCSSGNYSPYLGPDVVGLDLDLAALRRATGRNIQAIRSDANQPLPFKDGAFGFVFCSHLIEHVESPIHLLKEVHRVLKDGGLLILGFPIEAAIVRSFGDHYFDDHQGHLYSFSPSGIRKLLARTQFSVIRILVEPPLTTRFPRLRVLNNAVGYLPLSLAWRLSTATWVVAQRVGWGP